MFLMNNKIALGIDISAGKINLALLKQTAEGVELLKAVSTDVPPGAISDGNVKDPAALARAIKELQAANKIRKSRSVVSLVAKPAITQIIDLPKNMPGNVGQYIRSEVKHCAILPSKNIALDFCGIGSSGIIEGGRAFVVAADNEKIMETTKALSQAGVGVEAVEPAVVACARALYTKRIAGKYDSNVLIAVVRDTVVTVCVFKSQNLDFIRTRDIGKDILQSAQTVEHFVEEIAAIIQFYEMETRADPEKWQLGVVLERAGGDCPDIAKALKASLGNVDVQLSTPESVYQDSPVTASAQTEKPSITAIGLAMKLLETPQPNLRINLLPAEVAELSSTKTVALVTANAAVAVVIVMMLVAGALSLKLKKANEAIAALGQHDTQALIEEQQMICGQIDTLSEKFEKMNLVLASETSAGWHHILDDIRKNTPKTLCISRLFSRSPSEVFLEGKALSYETINVFVNMLGKSSYIDSVSLIETEKGDNAAGFVTYSVSCSLKVNKGI